MREWDFERRARRPSTVEPVVERAGSAAPPGHVAVQAKLRVGAVDDPLEREADRAADAVVRRLSGPADPHDGVLAVGDGPTPIRIHRRATGEGSALAGVGAAGGELDADVAGRIRRATSGGAPLEASTRERMEGAFGADFGGVQVHADSESHQLNAALNAQAFTAGSHVFLGHGAPAAGTTSGDHLLAHELSHTLQQGGARVRRSPTVIRRNPTVTENPLFSSATSSHDNPLFQGATTPDYPKVGDVLGEAVMLEKDGDKFEATVIMTDIEASFGVSIRSDKLAKAIPSNYGRAPKDVRKAVEAGVWQMKELRALQRALTHYAPILGANRKDSTRAKASQEAKYVGKVKKAIDTNSSKGVLDSTTMGEYFSKQKTLGLFDAGTDSTEDFADNLKQLEATAVHELAHGLFGHEVKGWAKEFDYWLDRYTESGKGGAEEPPSDYGHTNAAEDLCESVMFFFVDEARLKTSAPLRHAYVKKLVDGWKKDQTKGKKK